MIDRAVAGSCSGEDEKHARWHSGLGIDGRETRDPVRSRRTRGGVQLFAQQGKLSRLARDAGANGQAGPPKEAAQDADAVLLAVHWSRMDDVLNQAGDLSGKVIVTCSLPMDAGNTDLVVAHTSSGAEQLAKKISGAKVVVAFNTIPSEVLFGVFEARGNAMRPSMVYCGDTAAGKRIASQLIQDVGFDPVDAGSLQMARYMEPFAFLVGHLAYDGKGSPELAYRFERLGA